MSMFEAVSFRCRRRRALGAKRSVTTETHLDKRQPGPKRYEPLRDETVIWPCMRPQRTCCVGEVGS